ncbi:unnamed protein product [Rhizopus stolonifer]
MEFNNMAACSDDNIDFRPEDFIPGDSSSSVIEPTLSFKLPAAITPTSETEGNKRRFSMLVRNKRATNVNGTKRSLLIFYCDHLLFWTKKEMKKMHLLMMML